jgi:hypothetical protein
MSHAGEKALDMRGNGLLGPGVIKRHRQQDGSCQSRARRHWAVWEKAGLRRSESTDTPALARIERTRRVEVRAVDRIEQAGALKWEPDVMSMTDRGMKMWLKGNVGFWKPARKSRAATSNIRVK